MRVDLFDLNLIRALDALLQERSVSRAAKRLNVTQQAMSGSLRRLRDHFGDGLLVRVGRGLRPTLLGQALAEPVRELSLQIVATLMTHAIFDPAVSDRRFRISMSDYATLALLPHLMSQLAATAPNIVCEVEPLYTEMFDDLIAGRLDFCVLPRDNYLLEHEPSSGIRVDTMYTDDFVCVIDEHHPTIGETMTREQYISGSHNILRLGRNARSIIEEAWFVQDLHPKVIATTRSFASLIWMVPGTSLVATAQRRLASRFRGFLPIRVVECPISIPHLTACLQWHRRNSDDPAHAFMRDAILAAGEKV